MIWTPSPRPPRSQWLTNLMLRDATGFMSRPPRDARCTAEEQLSDARIGEDGCRMVLDARAAELEVMQPGQLGEDVAPLRDVADALGDQLTRRAVGDFAVVEEDPSGAHRQHAERRLEGRRLARAVRADDGGDRAAQHIERQPVQDRLLAVAGDDVLESEDVRSGQDKPRSPWDRGALAPGRPGR